MYTLPCPSISGGLPSNTKGIPTSPMNNVCVIFRFILKVGEMAYLGHVLSCWGHDHCKPLNIWKANYHRPLRVWSNWAHMKKWGKWKTEEKKGKKEMINAMSCMYFLKNHWSLTRKWRMYKTIRTCNLVSLVLINCCKSTCLFWFIKINILADWISLMM